MRRVRRAGCPGPEPRRTMRPGLGVSERVWMVGGFRGLSAVSSRISSSDRVASLERGQYSLTWATHFKRCRVGSSTGRLGVSTPLSSADTSSSSVSSIALDLANLLIRPTLCTAHPTSLGNLATTSLVILDANRHPSPLVVTPTCKGVGSPVVGSKNR